MFKTLQTDVQLTCSTAAGRAVIH